ncbi:MAG: SpoIIE family protein phosphatase [Pseudomonadales bacterium]|nr:SpoIIE family protein phosphatase [Pseudomonadales bacterium]
MFSIILPLLLIASVVMGLTLRRVYDSAVASLQDERLSEVRLLARGIDFELRSITQVAENTAALLRIQTTLDKPLLYNILRENTANNALIYGAAAAFEPFKADPGLLSFAPYVFGDDQQLLDLGSVIGDYTHDNRWYSTIRDQRKAHWSEPYFNMLAGGGHGIAVTTYATPIIRNHEFLGVASVDLRLDQLSQQLTRQTPAGDARVIIMSASGRFVSHYDPSLTLNGTLQEQAALSQAPDYQEVVDDILAGGTNLRVLSNRYIDGGAGNTWVLYTPIPSTGWFLATLLPEDALTQPLREQLTMALSGLALTIALIFLLVWWISARLSQPIQQLESAVSEVARGKLDTHIENIQSLDELGRLSLGFNRMLQDLKQQIELQTQQEANQRLLEREWQMARETQRALLPTIFPPFPEHKEFDLYAVNQAAQHVAGDYFDFFLINPKTLMLVIADVSGKGMSAALMMAVTRTIVRSLAQSGKSPADILRETNEQLRDSQHGAAFVTLFLGAYNLVSGRLVYANGGHTPPLLLARDGTLSSVGEATGTIVGMLEEQEYHNAEFRLQPGELLLLFTDGFPEARSPEGEFYGLNRVKTFLQNHSKSSAHEICEAAIAEINQFQNQHLADDITILALRRQGGGISGFLNDLVKPR